MSTDGKGEKDTGTYRAQVWEAEICVLVRDLSKRGDDAVESGEGYRNVLGQFLGGVDAGQG
jgi:hypothetical protein